MFKQVLPMPRTKTHGGKGSYVRVTTKMIYFSSDAEFGLCGKYVRIYYDSQNGTLLFQVSAKDDNGSFKVSPCHEATRAGRIETWNTVRALYELGFPLVKLGEELRSILLPDGSVIAYTKEVFHE